MAMSLTPPIQTHYDGSFDSVKGESWINHRGTRDCRDRKQALIPKMILAGVAGFEPAVEDIPLVGVKVRCLTSLAIPLYCAGSCSGVPPNQPVTDFQSRLWRVVKAFPLTHNLMVSYLERRTRLELAPPVWKTGVLTVEHQHRMVGFSLKLSHATGNYAPKSRSPYSVRSNRS